MSYFAILTAILSGAEQLVKLYMNIKKAASQYRLLTAEQEAELDARAEAIFSSPAADPDLNQ